MMPMAIAALSRITAWGVERIAQSLGARTAAIAERAGALGLEVAGETGRAPHFLGIALPEGEVIAAFEALEKAPGSVVLGPDLDGGYYLVGMAGGPADIFPAVMSTSSVLEHTVANAQAAGRPLTLLEPHLDVDTPDDLAAFWLEFGGRADVRHWATWKALDEHPAWERFGELSLG